MTHSLQVTPPTLHLCVKVAEVSEGQHSSSGCVPTPSTQRWVPPTAREQVDPMQTLFRKMRGCVCVCGVSVGGVSVSI